jgi:hypothetical protein
MIANTNAGNDAYADLAEDDKELVNALASKAMEDTSS